jgi:predicted secreted protein
MAKVNGTVMTIYSGSDLVLWTKNCTLNVEQDLPDATTKDSSGWEEHINGVRRWSIDFDGAFDVAGSGLTPNEIVAAIIARSADTVIKFGTSAAAATGWTGSGTFRSISISGELEGVATFSGFIKGNGALAAI